MSVVSGVSGGLKGTPTGFGSDRALGCPGARAVAAVLTRSTLHVSRSRYATAGPPADQGTRRRGGWTTPDTAAEPRPPLPRLTDRSAQVGSQPLSRTPVAR